MVVKRNIHKANDLPNSPENPVDVRDINSEAIKERLYMIALDENGRLSFGSEVTVEATGLTVDLGKLVLQAKNPNNSPVDMRADENGNLRVVLARNGMEYYGASIEDRPAPDSVPVGAAFMIVGTTNIWQSNGTDWVVI